MAGDMVSSPLAQKEPGSISAKSVPPPPSPRGLTPCPGEPPLALETHYCCGGTVPRAQSLSKHPESLSAASALEDHSLCATWEARTLRSGAQTGSPWHTVESTGRSWRVWASAGGLLASRFLTSLPRLHRLPSPGLQPEEREEVTSLIFPPSSQKYHGQRDRRDSPFTWDHIPSFAKWGPLFSFLWSLRCEPVRPNAIYRREG